MTSPNKTTSWLFLRGLTRDSVHWYDFPQIFETEFASTQLHLIDLPGVGKYSAEKTPLTIAENMEFVRKKYLENNSEKLWILSISMGSMVALEWALQFPEEIAGVVSINTSIGGLSPIYQRITVEGLTTVVKVAAEKDLIKREDRTLELITNLRRPLRPIAIDFAKAAEQHPVAKSTAAKQMIAAARYRIKSNPPKVPVLFLRSLGDRLVSSQCTLDLARYWHLQSKTHPTAGHDIPLDDAAWIIEQIREWLEGLG
ncbi:MAG: alpha/beta fold hydrolase [Pseudobdellovibrionaceae bacterium]